MHTNYQKMLEETLSELSGRAAKPRLLLHACCAPCASYVLEYLEPYFEITLFFYNPNIYPPKEYDRRLEELKRLCAQAHSRVTFYPALYEPQRFYALAQELADTPEGGPRCQRCFELRLEASALAAGALSADYFTTTLTISPHKNAARLNEIGQSLAALHGVPYLCSDFKKKDGYKRSLTLSKTYGLYRQSYCGCSYSLKEAQKRAAARLAPDVSD